MLESNKEETEGAGWKKGKVTSAEGVLFLPQTSCDNFRRAVTTFQGSGGFDIIRQLWSGNEAMGWKEMRGVGAFTQQVTSLWQQVTRPQTRNLEWT